MKTDNAGDGRKVQIFEGIYSKEEKKYILEPKAKGIFRCFGINFQEFENGIGNFTTAIIEMTDGSLRNEPIEHIQFIEEKTEQQLQPIPQPMRLQVLRQN